jgi:hypothetical protein
MRFIVTTLLVSLFAASALAADYTGTWKLNQARSPDPIPSVSSMTITVESIGPNAYRTIMDSVSQSGEKKHITIDRTYDGKERHVEDGGPPQGTEICEITPDGVRKITVRDHGNTTAVIESIISADGKTKTHIVTNARGKHVAIFDKQ